MIKLLNFNFCTNLSDCMLRTNGMYVFSLVLTGACCHDVYEVLGVSCESRPPAVFVYISCTEQLCWVSPDILYLLVYITSIKRNSCEESVVIRDKHIIAENSCCIELQHQFKWFCKCKILLWILFTLMHSKDKSVC